MSLVSRAVAAATRTATSAALDSETQERVKDAIREHLRHSGLIPPVDAGDPAATPTPTPGGGQPQDLLNKKEGSTDDKAAAALNPKAGRKGPLGTAANKGGEGNAKRKGKLSRKTQTPELMNSCKALMKGTRSFDKREAPDVLRSPPGATPGGGTTAAPAAHAPTQPTGRKACHISHMLWPARHPGHP